MFLNLFKIKYRKENRLKTYKIILNTNKYEAGFCHVLKSIHLYENDLTKYPELMKHKPKRNFNNGAYWFEPYDWTERDKILKLAIEELETKLKK